MIHIINIIFRSLLYNSIIVAVKHTMVLGGGYDKTMSQHTEVPGVHTFVSKQHL